MRGARSVYNRPFSSREFFHHTSATAAAEPFQTDLSSTSHPTHAASNTGNGGIKRMLRLAFYVGGVAAGLAAWMVWRDQIRANRRVPAKEAAAMLAEAWADHHTRA
jgi:hypothetical protein